MGLLKTAPQVRSTSNVQLALSWDPASKPTDVDLQVCLFDSLGLILDACFFNNKAAAGGAMMLSGDSKDGAASGVDESVTINLSQLPPHAYAIVAGIYCTGSGVLADARNVGVLASEIAPGGAATPLANNAINDAGNTSGMMVFVLQKQSADTWTVAMDHTPLQRCRNFADALGMMQTLLKVDPALQKEVQAKQPVFNLKKGETAPVPTGLLNAAFGLGWDAGCDVDASVVCLGPNKTVTDIVYYGNKTGLSGGVHHSGDNLTGEGFGDDETIELKLTEIPPTTTHLFLTVNVFTGGKDFRDVKGEFVHIYDTARGPKAGELLRYGALDSHGANNGVVLACLYRDEGCPQRWLFSAISMGAKGRTCKDLVDECQDLQPTMAASTARQATWAV